MKLKSVILLLSLVLAMAATAKDFKIGNAKYEILNNQTVMLKDYKKATGDIVIPSTVTNPSDKQQYAVTKIGEAFKNSSVTSVVIPNSVDDIKMMAFYRCKALTKVTLPPTIKKIPLWAFSDCEKLSEINLDYVEEIGSEAFRNCKALSNINISQLRLIDIGALSGTNLTSVSIPASLMALKRGAFLGCGSLTHVTFENTTSSGDSDKALPLVIESYVFKNVPIKSLTINRSMQYAPSTDLADVPNSPFSGQSALAEVTIGNMVNDLPDHVFDGCGSLKKVVYDIKHGDDFNSSLISKMKGLNSAVVKIPSCNLEIPEKDLERWCNAFNILKELRVPETYGDNWIRDRIGRAIAGMMDCPELLNYLQAEVTRLEDEYIESNKNNLSSYTANYLGLFNNMHLRGVVGDYGYDENLLANCADWFELVMYKEKFDKHKPLYECIVKNFDIANSICEKNGKRIEEFGAYLAMQKAVALIGLGREKEAAIFFQKCTI